MVEHQTPILIVTGPPAAGKTSLCRALAKRWPRSFHLPMDDLRTWVVAGLADSVPWTEETERQFRVAEDAACDVALRYQRAGFAVLVDHCRNLQRWDALVADRLSDVPVAKICLLPSLDATQDRNIRRVDKAFDPAILSDTIAFTHARFSEPASAGWLVLDNTSLGVEASADAVLALLPR